MVNTFPGFESQTAIKKMYSSFQLDTKEFSDNNKQRYHGGVPVMYDAESRRVYLDSSDRHTLVYGTTGSLKTRTVVMPTIKLLGYAGESMIINDTKGELHTRMAGTLKKQGYDIVEVNFRDPRVGNAWNPLYIPYQYYMAGDIDNASAMVNDIANNLMLENMSKEDPFWNYAAADVMYGLIMLLFRYCKDHETSLNVVNISSVMDLRHALYSSSRQAPHTMLWKYASQDRLIRNKLSVSVYAPNATRDSILSVFDGGMAAFVIQPTLMNMLGNNDFDIADIGRKKTAVFLITPDEKTTYHRLVSLFVKESYEYLIYMAMQNPEGRVQNRINYILDEFSSLPKIADMPVMISAARSRDIRFLLVLQSKGSLTQRYGDEAGTITTNCQNWIFFTSRELELLRELSELCGVQRNQMPNISVYDLQHFNKEKREALVLLDRLRPAKVSMLDIDRFGDKTYPVLDYAVHERQKNPELTFELKNSILSELLGSGQQPAVKRPVNSSQKEQGITGVMRHIDQRLQELDAAEDAAHGGEKGGE